MADDLMVIYESLLAPMACPTRCHLLWRAKPWAEALLDAWVQITWEVLVWLPPALCGEKEHKSMHSAADMAQHGSILT